MAKARTTAFFCSECGYESAKWMGQCPACRAWNTMVEEPLAPAVKSGVRRGLGAAVEALPLAGREGAGTAAGGFSGGQGSRRAAFRRGVPGYGASDGAGAFGTSLPAGSGAAAGGGRIDIRNIRPRSLSEIEVGRDDRVDTGFEELNRVLGGGIVKGSLVLVGGDPGIGKSTILLQVCRNLAGGGQKVLYISGEESLKQIKLRAGRIGQMSESLCFLCETDLGIIDEVVRRTAPDTVIIDSIQTMYLEEVSSAPGSVSQVRECTNVLMQIAKGFGITVFIVGHVTKEGVVAGPRVLEHMVDTVLYFEGDRHASYRILRGVKNRFGSTNEIGVFEMREEGLAEVKNPSEFMLEGRPAGASGAVAACSIEGTRPMMAEVQALVTRTNFGMPRRTAAGTDYNRVNLLMAVLEKRCRYDMGQMDAYVNIAGGLKMNEPAMDLAIAMALISSYKDRPLDEKTVVFGEVGLSGEVRSVSMAEQRVNEAVKLGFEACILPKVCMDKMKKRSDIRLIGVSSVKEAASVL